MLSLWGTKLLRRYGVKYDGYAFTVRDKPHLKYKLSQTGNVFFGAPLSFLRFSSCFITLHMCSLTESCLVLPFTMISIVFLEVLFLYFETLFGSSGAVEYCVICWVSLSAVYTFIIYRYEVYMFQMIHFDPEFMFHSSRQFFSVTSHSLLLVPQDTQYHFYGFFLPIGCSVCALSVITWLTFSDTVPYA